MQSLSRGSVSAARASSSGTAPGPSSCPRPARLEPTQQRLVRPDLGPCWEWAGGTHGNGYGKLYDGTRTVSAHRLAYETWVGPIPAGASICHRCDNPPCINPEHLVPGTTAENHADMRAKGRRTDPVRLTDNQVTAIRVAHTGARGDTTRLAVDYGVSVATVSLIVRGLHR